MTKNAFAIICHEKTADGIADRDEHAIHPKAFANIDAAIEQAEVLACQTENRLLQFGIEGDTVKREWSEDRTRHTVTCGASDYEYVVTPIEIV